MASKLRVNEVEDLNGNPLWKSGEGILGDVTTSTGTQTVAGALDERIAQYDIRKFGGVANTDITSNLIDAVSAVSTAGGGEIYIPFSCSLTAPIALADNVKIKVENSATIDCSDQTTGNYTIGAFSDFGSEVNLAVNVSSGDINITTATAHGLAVGDWCMIKSQRACSIPEDAGEWTLGETTENTTSPFFAECKQVREVVSATEFVINTGLIFPDYRTDDSEETYLGARPSTTIQKINFLEGVGVSGGLWIRSNEPNIALFRIGLCKEPVFKVKMELGTTAGMGLRADNCLMGKFDLSAERPVGWERVESHDRYNSFKDVGCWNCEWNLIDVRGCQGWDQSFTSGGVPSLFPIVKTISVDNYEDGATTHGNCYGASIKVKAINPRVCGYRGRAPFTTAHVEMDGPGLGDVLLTGVILSAYGAVNSHYSGHARNCEYAVDIRQTGVVLDTPPVLNTTIGPFFMENITHHGINYRNRTDTNTLSSNLRLKDLMTVNCRRMLYVGSYNHGVTLDGAVVSGGPLSLGLGHIEYRQNSMGNMLSNVMSSNLADSASSLILASSNSDAALLSIYPLGLNVDWDTVKHTGVGSVANLGLTRSAYQDVSDLTYTTSSKDTGGHIYFLSASINKKLTVTNDIPIGGTVKITHASVGVTELLLGTGITEIRSGKGLFLSGAGASATLTRITSSIFVATGDLQATA